MECHVTIDDPAQPVLDLLAFESRLSKQQIKQAMHKGALWRTRGKQAQRIRRAPKTPQVGDTLHLYYDTKVLAEAPREPLLIADENAYSVWYKPYGMRSQGSKWGDHCTLYRWVEVNLRPERPAFLVHRLDRAATGLMMIGHSKKVTAALTKLFEQRQLDKRYRVIVAGQFAADVGVWAKQQRFTGAVDGKTAVSYARCLAYDADSNRSLLEVRIETGRKHQIRCHLAAAGFPVIGDRRYGGAGEGENLQLTASTLAFVCPVTGNERQYQLPAELLPAF